MIEIDKGVPIPEKIQGPRLRYPFNYMEVGDSFFVPLNGRKAANVMSSISGSARSGRAASAGGRRFTSRRVTENGVPGIRCWRFA